MQERTHFFVTLFLILCAVCICIVLGFYSMKRCHDGKIASSNERYFNSIIGRYFKFNSMIIGTSMSENFKCSEFDKVTGGYAQKLTLSGGHISEIAFTAEYAMKYQKIETVLLDIMTRSFILAESRFELPMNLYKESIPLSDRVCDTLSLETIFRNLRNLLKKNSFDRDKSYSWAYRYPCGLIHFSKYMIEK